MDRRRALGSALTLVGAAQAGRVFAQDRKPVQWAGISLAGDFAQLPRLMPTLYELTARDAAFRDRFSLRASQAVAQVAPSHPNLRILVDEQMRQGDDAYALTLVLAGESVTSFVIEQTTFVDYTVQALVLVGNVSKDPSRQRIVASYPVQVKYQHAYPDGQLPGSGDRKAIIAGMLMGERGQADLVGEWHKRLRQIQIKERDVWVAVAPLQILPEAQQQGGFSKDQADSVAFKVSSAIEGNLSRAAGIPIVPTAVGDSLGKLTLSFADRGIVAFDRPDPSYQFQVSVYGLGMRVAQEAMTREKKFAVAYGGGFLVEYFSIDPDRKRNLELGLRLQSVQSVTYLGTSQDARRASAPDMFARLISGFCDELSSNLIPANARWLERYKASSEPRAASELARLASARLPAPRRAD